MSDAHSEQPGEASDLEGVTLQREKLRAEVRKLKVDNSLANRLFTTILSVSAVVIAGSQIWMAAQQREADQVRADHDETLKQIELHIRQVESGLKLSQFAIDQRTLFLAASADEQVRAVRLVQALLPPEEAGRMLDAMGKVATQAEVLSEVALGKQQLSSYQSPLVRSTPAPSPPQVSPPPAPPAPRSPAPASSAPAPAQSTAANAPGPAASPAVTPQVVPAPAAIAGLPLTLYYHVQRAEDRDLANAVAAALAPQKFPSAGVQIIPQGPTQAQVRYYKPAQKEAAQALAELLSQQVSAQTGAAVPFKPVDISATFPNLPGGRMEVWFARVMPPLKSS